MGNIWDVWVACVYHMYDFYIYVHTCLKTTLVLTKWITHNNPFLYFPTFPSLCLHFVCSSEFLEFSSKTHTVCVGF